MNKEQILFFFSSIGSSLINSTKDLRAQNFEKILIVKLDEIGDMLYILHVIDALRESYPEGQIDIWCKKMNNGLVVDRINGQILNDIKKPNSRYDLVVDLRGTWRSLFWALWGGTSFRLDRGTIRIRNKFQGGQKHERITNWEIVEPVVSKNYRDPSLLPNTEDVTAVSSLLAEIGIEKFALIHTGARDEVRRWPFERFIELAEYLKDRYQLPTLVCGGPEEVQLLEQKLEGFSFIHSVAGRTSLNQLGVLAKKASVFIGNESGPLHFATLAKTPLVALFGPGVEGVFYPYHQTSKIIHPLGLPTEKRMEAITFDNVKIQVDQLMV